MTVIFAYSASLNQFPLVSQPCARNLFILALQHEMSIIKLHLPSDLSLLHSLSLTLTKPSHYILTTSMVVDKRRLYELAILGQEWHQCPTYTKLHTSLMSITSFTNIDVRLWAARFHMGNIAQGPITFWGNLYFWACSQNVLRRFLLWNFWSVTEMRSCQVHLVSADSLFHEQADLITILVY